MGWECLLMVSAHRASPLSFVERLFSLKARNCFGSEAEIQPETLPAFGDGVQIRLDSITIDSRSVNVIQNDFDKSASPFSLRAKARARGSYERQSKTGRGRRRPCLARRGCKVRMRGIKSNTFVDDFDPLTPTLSRREREKRRCLSRNDRDFGGVPEISNFVWIDIVHKSVTPMW